MKKLFKLSTWLSLPLLLISSIAMAENISFMWTPNTESNLAGYRIYYSETEGDYTREKSVDCGLPEIKTNDNGDERITYTIDIDPGEYYFTATAYDTDGFESDYAEVIHHTVINLPPAAPKVKICILQNNADGSVDVLDVDGNLLFHVNP
jgi:hypothetical protein